MRSIGDALACGTRAARLRRHRSSIEDAMSRMLIAALAAPLFLPLAAGAQWEKSLQRFPLNKPIAEAAVTVCVSAEVPIRVNTLLADEKSDEASLAYVSAVSAGQCANGRGVITYLRQVHRIDSSDGAVLTVYEATAGGAHFFVPMVGFLHQDLRA
jgi:hypothetical protein